MTTPPQPPPPPPPPGGAATPPPGYANNEEKTWALVAHFGGAVGIFLLSGVGGWIGPLVALLAKGNESPTVRARLEAELPAHLVDRGVIGWATMCIVIGFLILPVAVLMGIIFGIIAGVRANEGALYRYPASVKMIK